MHQAKQQEPPHSPVMKRRTVQSFHLGPLGKEQNPRPEQHGEDAHELFSGQDMAEYPDPSVQSGQITIGGGINACSRRHGKMLDVHDQDTQNSQSAKQINGDNAISFRNRGKCTFVHGNKYPDNQNARQPPVSTSLPPNTFWKRSSAGSKVQCEGKTCPTSSFSR